MFGLIVLVLFTYSISKIEVQCFIIGHESHISDDKGSTKLPENLTLLKKIEKIAIQSESMNLSEMKNEKLSISTGKNKSQVDLNDADISRASIPEYGNEIIISNRKNVIAEEDVGPRQPKFFGSLAFLTGLGAGSLATAASVNANAFVRLFNPTIPVPIGAPGYFAGFYEPQTYSPFPYPILYPVPRPVINYQNLVTGIPVAPFPFMREMFNVTASTGTDKNDTDLLENDGPGEQPENENGSKRETTVPEAIEDSMDSPANNEEVELRQGFSGSRGSTTSTPMITTTTNSSIFNTTPETDVEVPSTSQTNTTESLPFHGYYGGSPQNVGNLIFTTEDPQQRYLKDYTQNRFALPFERPAVFNPYQNIDSYQSSFIHSFSPGDELPEFLNTVDSDRYAYDSLNRRTINGFRPILK